GEVCFVGDLVEKPEEIFAAGAQRQVDNPRALDDCPANAGREDHALACQPTAEDPHRPYCGIRRGPPDDPGTRGAVTEQIVVRTLRAYDLVRRRVPPQSDGAADRPDGRVAGVDPAVNHGDGDSGAGGTTPCPVLVDGHTDPRHRAQRLRGEG